jgi:hypothetical protein
MRVFSIISNLAEEEGFYFVEYEAGTRWHALVCYIRNVETKGFTVSPHPARESRALRQFLPQTGASLNPEVLAPTLPSTRD